MIIDAKKRFKGCPSAFNGGGAMAAIVPDIHRDIYWTYRLAVIDNDLADTEVPEAYYTSRREAYLAALEEVREKATHYGLIEVVRYTLTKDADMVLMEIHREGYVKENWSWVSVDWTPAEIKAYATSL